MIQIDGKAEKKGSFMEKLAGMIVDKRILIFLVIGIGVVFSVFSRTWVVVENDLTEYLPADSETRKGMDLMEKEFTTFGSAKLMIGNISYSRANEIAEELRDTLGVQRVVFDDTTDHYNHVSALFEITFDYPKSDDRCLDILDTILERYAAYDKYVEMGGEYLLETEATELLFEDGSCVGAKAVKADGTDVTIHAKAVLCCSGGYAGSEDLQRGRSKLDRAMRLTRMAHLAGIAMGELGNGKAL